MQRVIIVGGGLVGCVLAIYLAQRGFAVTIYERNADARRAQKTVRPSMSLTLCTRGIRSLERIGVMDRVHAIAAPVSGRMVHAADRSQTYQPYSAHGDRIFCVSRRQLSATLLDAAIEQGVAVVFERECLDLDPATGEIGLRDAAGQTRRDRAPAIFAADGCFSRVRERLHRSGWWKGDERRSTQGYKELRIPEPVATAASLRRDALHLWPRQTLMAAAFGEVSGAFACTVHLPLTGSGSFETVRDASSVTALFETHLPDLAPLVPGLATQFLAQQPNSMVTIHCAPWTAAGRVLLIGDAAHGMLPYYGQGANAGFQDCEILDELVARHAGDWARIFTEFERVRRPDTDAMATLCAEHLAVLRDLVGRPDYQRRAALERRLEELLPDAFTPLYSMVSFSSMSYAEARRRDARQQHVLDALLSDDRGDDLLAQPAERLRARAQRLLAARTDDDVALSAAAVC
jgi:kynurenine 3-monooxygenase